MPVRHLDEQQVSALRAATLASASTGRLTTDADPGFTTLRRATVLVRRDFDAVDRLPATPGG